MSISPARIAAFTCLHQIALGKGLSSELLPKHTASLSDRDRGLCYELTLGTLRRQIYLDEIIRMLATARTLDIEVRIAIRLGLYQLRFLERVPSYSAINESVELVRRAKRSSAAGFVNAVLRRSMAEPPKIEFADELDSLSVETSHPRWLLERWIVAFGPAIAEEIARSNDQIPTTAFRPIRQNGRPLASETIAALENDYARSTLVFDCYLVNQITPALRTLIESGAIYVQDEGSQLVAQLVPLNENGRVLDLCAAPGSKTSAIVSRASAEGKRVDIVAGDITNRRISFLRQNCIDQGVSGVAFAQYDAQQELPFQANSFDTILIDAPCSGTGTIRNNPEIRYRLTPEAFTTHAARQLRMLENAASVLRPRGLMIYSTCSLEPEENEGVITAFLNAHPDLGIVRPPLPEHLLTSDGFVRTFPHRDNMDGFFVAILRRSK